MGAPRPRPPRPPPRPPAPASQPRVATSLNNNNKHTTTTTTTTTNNTNTRPPAPASQPPPGGELSEKYLFSVQQLFLDSFYFRQYVRLKHIYQRHSSKCFQLLLQPRVATSLRGRRMALEIRLLIQVWQFLCFSTAIFRTRRSHFGPDGMPCVVLWRPEALDCRVRIPPEAWSGPTHNPHCGIRTSDLMHLRADS